MNHPFTDKFLTEEKNRKFTRMAMMGPNSMRVGEELTSRIDINKGMKVLDLGCGMGLSTILLAQKYGAKVFAADLWISPTDNYERFREYGIQDSVVPLRVNALEGLAFANRFFDVLFSVGAYQYFAQKPDMLSTLIPLVKSGGYIAISLNGLKYEFGDEVPSEMMPYWNEDVRMSMHSVEWWSQVWQKDEGIEIIDISQMPCHDQTWKEWLEGWSEDLPFAQIVAGDIEMMKAEGGKYFNTIQLIAKVI